MSSGGNGATGWSFQHTQRTQHSLIEGLASEYPKTKKQMNGRTAKGILFFPWVSQTRTSIVCFPGGIFYIFCLKKVDWKFQDLRRFGAGTESPECLGVRKMCGIQKHKMRFKGFLGCCLWCKCINIRRLVDYIYWGGVGLRSYGSFGFYKSRVQVRSLHAGRYRRIDIISWTLYIEIFKKCH